MIQTAMKDLVFARGDDWPFIPFNCVLDDLVTQVDITGWTLEFALFLNDAATPLFTLTNGSGLTVDDAPHGLLHVMVSSANSSKCRVTGQSSPTSHFWEIHRIDAGQRRLLGFGTIPVRI